MILPAFWPDDVARVIRTGSAADARRAREFVRAAHRALLDAVVGRFDHQVGYLFDHQVGYLSYWITQVACA